VSNVITTLLHRLISISTHCKELSIVVVTDLYSLYFHKQIPTEKFPIMRIVCRNSEYTTKSSIKSVQDFL
jgi:hypothetical protein